MSTAELIMKLPISEHIDACEREGEGDHDWVNGVSRWDFKDGSALEFEGTDARIVAPQFQVEPEMLGQDFLGSLGDLIDFVRILAEVSERPATDFVIREHTNQAAGAIEPSEREWLEAREKFEMRHPELWRRVGDDSEGGE